jgi:hypothetical protein
MPKVDWAYLCDLAYFDNQHQLCVIGIDTGGPVRTLCTGVYRFTIVARLLDVTDEDTSQIAVSVATPRGPRLVETRPGAAPERRGEYLLVSIGNEPFYDEGVYRFEVALGSLSSFDVPLVISNARQPAWGESRAS